MTKKELKTVGILCGWCENPLGSAKCEKCMYKNFKKMRLTKEVLDQHEGGNGKPSIYVGTYSKYNAGSLYGMWVDLTSFEDYDEFEKFCRELHIDEDDPEFMIQDFEHFPKVWYHESGLPTAVEFERIQAFAELDEDDREAYEIFLENFNAEASVDDFRERYVGNYGSGADFAEQLVEDCGDLENVPDWLQCCIDWEAVWRNLETGGSYSEYNGHIFIASV